MHTNKFSTKVILTVVFILALTSCTRQPASPTATATVRLNPHLPSTTTFLQTETPLPSMTPTKVFNGNIEKGDYLIYRFDGEKKLFFYDPATNIHIPILADWEIGTYAVSINDQIAFSAKNGGESDVYILDYPYWENTPINITTTPESSEFTISWSPDGNYLILHKFQEIGDFLLVWDGTYFSQIYEFIDGRHLGFSEKDWSTNGKFAFTVFGENTSKTDKADIYVWDGNPDHAAFNVSQNPLEASRFPSWSSQGQLAYFSESILYVWDGISFKNSVPDSSTFIELPFENCFPFPNWTYEDDLYVCHTLFTWDGTNLIPTQEFESIFEFGGNWRSDGYRAVTTDPYYPYGNLNPQQLYIFDAENNLLLQTEGRDGEWSPEGQLAFCVWNHSEDNSFTISIWNGIEIKEVIRHDGYMTAMWRNGNYIHCTNG